MTGESLAVSVGAVSTDPPSLFATHHDSKYEVVLSSCSQPGMVIEGKFGQAGQDNSWDSMLMPSSDQAAVQDQNVLHVIGTPQMTTCMQVQAPVMQDITQAPTQGLSTTMWLQQGTSQPAVFMTQQDMMQQPPSHGMWGSAGQVQLQPVAMGPAGAVGVGNMTAVLPDSSVVTLVPQHTSTPISTGMPVYVQVQGSATGQPLQQQVSLVNPMPQQQLQQQVYLLPTGEQLLNTSNNTGSMVQCAPVYVAPANGGSSNMQLQLRELHGTVHQLSYEGAQVQAVQSSTHDGSVQDVQQAQGAQTHTGSAGSSEHKAAALMATCPSSSSSPTCNPISQESSHSSSWQRLDSLGGSTTSSPSCAMRNNGRLASGPQVMGAVDMPQANVGMLGTGQGIQHVSHPQVIGTMAPGANGTVVVLGNGTWPPGTIVIAPGTQIRGNYHAAGGVVSGSGSGQMQDQGPVVQGHANDQQAYGGPRYTARRITPAMAGFRQRPARFGKPAASFRSQGTPRGTTARFSTPAAPAPAKAPAEPAEVGAEGTAGEPAAAPVDAAGRQLSSVESEWSQVPLEEGLKQLWSAEQLLQARGGRLFNVQQLAWHPVGEPDPCPQDMYNFQKLKRTMQKLDAVHKNRVRLIKRIHAVADHGHGELKSVYREVRCLIGELLHDAATQIKSLEECRMTGLVRLALMLQEALLLGPKPLDGV